VVNGPEDRPAELGLDAVDWDWVDWSGCEREVRRLRQRIFKATQDGDWPRVRSLQRLMLRSRSNTLLSVRQVTQRNAGRKTAGIDGEVALTSQARADVAVRVHSTVATASRGQARVHTEGIKPCEAAAARHPRDHGSVPPGTGA
jgi:RNA-directed DNA polymerase